MITIQSDAASKAAEAMIEKQESFFQALSKMSFHDAISKFANDIVQFGIKILVAILVFYVGKFIIKRLYNLLRTLMIARNTDASLTSFALSLLKITLYFILIVTIVGILGLETSSFLALFASAGVAVGMALSGTLQNFAGGVLILLLKPYRVGDYIEAQGYSGTVKAIQIFNTIVNTPDNKSIIIPNGGLSTSSINNYSLEDYRRVDWTIALSYSTNFAEARKAILEILDSDGRVVKKYPEGHRLSLRDCTPFVGLGELADSSINITVRAWTKSSDYWNLFFDLNERFYTELPQHGFSFPFPQLDVHLN